MNRAGSRTSLRGPLLSLAHRSQRRSPRLKPSQPTRFDFLSREDEARWGVAVTANIVRRRPRASTNKEDAHRPRRTNRTWKGSPLPQSLPVGGGRGAETADAIVWAMTSSAHSPTRVTTRNRLSPAGSPLPQLAFREPNCSLLTPKCGSNTNSTMLGMSRKEYNIL